MARILGSVVGALMAGVGFPGIPNRFRNGKDQILVRDKAVLTSANVIGDYVVLGTFKSSAYISPSAKIWFDGAGTSVTLNVGDIAHPTGLSSAIDISATGSADLSKGFSAVKMDQPLWQRLGYSSDPGGNIELRGIVAGAQVVTASVNIAWQIPGQDS